MQGKIANKIMHNSRGPAPKPTGNDVKNFDATTHEELLTKIKSLFAEFRKAPTKKEPDENTIRPLYVELGVVNKAYQIWLKEPKKTPCNAQQKEVIFADPPPCMRIAPGPGRIPRLINLKRLNRRASQPKCIYTTVRCLEKNFFSKKAADIIKDVSKQYKNANGAFWIQRALFGPRAEVEKAWKEWNKAKLNGKEGILSGGSICGKPEGEVRAHEGSLYAQFAQNEQCLSPDTALDKQDMYGMDSDCKSVIVECVG